MTATVPLLQRPVRTFFCPELAEGRLSFSDSLNKRIIDLCASFSIESVGDLTAKTIDELRGASFPAQEVSRIVQTLSAHGLALKSTFASSGARGVCAPVSVRDVPGRGAGYAQPWIMNP